MTLPPADAPPPPEPTQVRVLFMLYLGPDGVPQVQGPLDNPAEMFKLVALTCDRLSAHYAATRPGAVQVAPAGVLRALPPRNGRAK